MHVPTYIKKTMRFGKSAAYGVYEAFWTMWPHHGRRITWPAWHHGPVKDAIPVEALCTQLCAWARAGFPEEPGKADTIAACLELR